MVTLLQKKILVEGVEKLMPPTTAEEKAQKRLEMKARITLMMGIPNEHQLKFNSIKDAKLLLEAIEKRFGGNAATKKTQRNLLKQHRLDILGETLSQEDVNQKLLRSLPPEWNTHAVVWRNKPELEIMSMDDLYKNLKVYELEVKGTSSSSTSIQNIAFVSSNNSGNTNKAVNTAHGVFVASTQANAANLTNVDNLSDAIAMLTIRARRFLKNTGRKLIVNVNESIGFDKSKVECYNCHKRGHFAKECRAPRNQDNINRESSRRSAPVETTTSNALISCDGLGGYDSEGNPQMDLKDQEVIDSGCSRHMSYLTDFEEIDEGYVAIRANPERGKITGRGTIKTSNLDFENVYFVRQLKFNLFSVSQMCDKKNSVLFNDTEYIVLSPNFKLTDESHVLLKVPRKNNMCSVDLKNIVPKEGLTCLFAKATSDESNLWHRRLGQINFKTMNKLVKGNLVKGLTSKLFENDQTCVACQKGKQHRASSPDDGFKPLEILKEVTVEPVKKGGYCPDDLNMPELEDIVYSDDDEGVGAEADMTNLDAFMPIRPILTTRIHKDHQVEQIIGDLNSAPQTRRMIKNLEEHEEPKKVWTLVDLPNAKRAIGTKWVYKNKKDERGIVIKNKARWMSKLIFCKIEEEVYVCQPPGFEDLDFPNRVYKVNKALYGLHQAHRAWYETLSTYLFDNGFQSGKIDKTLFIRRDKVDILLVQVYVD
ncbi:putative ribonuclease H-like domain-containing protein [Tanacetum coccineum]